MLPAISDAEIQTYRSRGYLLLESFIDAGWVEALSAKTDELVDASRVADPGDWRFDTEPDHASDAPRLRRINSPVDVDPLFETFSLDGPATDIAEALLGPDVRFHHSKLNLKWSDGGEEVKWHQDIAFWPHTDFSPLTIGVYLRDVDEAMGPMGVVPGSHTGELFDLTTPDGAWTGSIRDEDLPRARTEEADHLVGPAGSVTVHNCCAVHGSQPNGSDRVRPLLLQTYSRADSYPLLGVGTNGLGTRRAHQVVRGSAPDHLEIDGRRMPTAPDWFRGSYTSIFDVQQRTHR
ncbi:MAG: phytanoyl-CoA dioxygenase family protein [Acidimicrobiia bacterium]|nr:phytanoyl-CoA dioxygenase family protein [Acidimicrobiia bacterium]MDH5237130.1 phytanoyl-CoA dioxygenase family protein [Acidimicrobiia bacterium]